MGPDPARGKTGGSRGSRKKANPSQAGEERGIGGKGESEPCGEGCKQPAGTRITRQRGIRGVGTGSEVKWGDRGGSHVLKAGTRHPTNPSLLLLPLKHLPLSQLCADVAVADPPSCSICRKRLLRQSLGGFFFYIYIFYFGC